MTNTQVGTEDQGAHDRAWARVALPDGRYAWEVPASAVADLEDLVTSAAAQLFPRATVVATGSHGRLPSDGTLSVTLQRHPGGAAVQVHCAAEFAAAGTVNAAGFALLGEVVVSSGEALPAQSAAEATTAPRQEAELAGAVATVGDRSDPAAADPARSPHAPVGAAPVEVDVPPRDAAERLAFGTWAVVTGRSSKGIFATLPILDAETAARMATRLTDRAGGEITVDDVLDAETVEQLAETVRLHLEDGLRIDGLVRTLRPRAEGSNAVPVFVFHPAGGSTVAYEPLLRRLPAHTPMFGLERVEGPLADRAQQYVPLVRAIQGDGPYVLCGWSFGGALAYAVAKQLRREGADVRLVGLIDTVLPGVTVENTPDEIRARWQRYAAFAKKTYHFDVPLPYDRLAAAGSDEEQIGILMQLLARSGAKIPAGIIEHQRTSWLDNRAIPSTDLESYDRDVVLYMAERYLDDQIALEPAFATRQPDGGWGEAVERLEVIPVGCDHIQIVDEPYVGKVAADLADRLAAIASAPVS